ncbi:hypothetical protein K435DRAFT_662114 [Dendrothele bispora CBS 962.96]|uniref:Uncharacterized protein n=1 Tax=Dendrothele bispora (strain CBS 962.96) TaxID=1314807 RepID=A0A4S8M6D5_DENBC|nr:hypothetical protein K435DRAFT_662114 [Dendrothele bispora CBS 962.96]
MFVPFISSKYSTSRKRRYLERRKGGGGGGKGGGGGSSGGGRVGGSGTSASGGGRTSSVSTGGGTSRSATSFGNGGGSVSNIPSGSLFAGRTQGGGTRNQVYGTSGYGSGYPGVSGLGVASRGFPFFFWPIAWGGAAGVGSAAFLHNREYGNPDNSSRPGGPMMFATFVSSSSQNTTFHVVSDNTTVTDLISDIFSNCSSSINNSSSTTSTPLTFNDSDPSAPNAQSAIQYYRASSVVLTLDGYNNSATWGNTTDSTPDTPLPSNIDGTLRDCLNATIGNAVPLVDGGLKTWSNPTNVPGLIALVWVVLHLSSVV